MAPDEAAAVTRGAQHTRSESELERPVPVLRLYLDVERSGVYGLSAPNSLRREGTNAPQDLRKGEAQRGYTNLVEAARGWNPLRPLPEFQALLTKER